MKHSIWAAVLLAASGCGPQVLVIPMQAENNSGQVGASTLTEQNGGVTVEISVQPSVDSGSQLAHIHTGRCGELGPALAVLPDTGAAVPLDSVVNGKSRSELKGVSLADLRGGKYAINVHYSKDITLYVSCGNIP